HHDLRAAHRFASPTGIGRAKFVRFIPWGRGFWLRADEYNFIAEIIRRLGKREAVTQAGPYAVRTVIAQPSFLRIFPQPRAGQPRGSRSQAWIGSGSRKRPMPAHDGVQVRIEPGNT